MTYIIQAYTDTHRIYVYNTHILVLTNMIEVMYFLLSISVEVHIGGHYLWELLVLKIGRDFFSFLWPFSVSHYLL